MRDAKFGISVAEIQ